MMYVKDAPVAYGFGAFLPCTFYIAKDSGGVFPTAVLR